MALDVDGFRTDLLRPQPTIKNCLSKTCCGCAHHVRDEFEGTRPWPCYWRSHNFIDPNFTVPDKDLSSWTVANGILTLGHGVNVLGAGGTRVFSDSIWVKLRPMVPPWTIEAVAKVSVPFYQDANGFDRTFCQFNLSAMGAPRLQATKVSVSGPSSWSVNLSSHGAVTPQTAMTARTAEFHDLQDIKIYLRYSLNTNHEITIDVRLDDAALVLESQNDGFGRPYVDVLPYTCRLDTQSVYNRWLEREAYTFEISPRFGPATVDYLEARIQPGII